MNNYFDDIDWSTIFQDNNINENYNIFLEYISSAVEDFIPKTNPHIKTKNTPQWWTKSLSKAIKLKHSLFSKWKHTKLSTDYKIYATQCNLVKAKVRSAQVKFEETLIQRAQTKPKLLYGYIKAKQKVKASIGSLQKANGCFTLDDYDTAEELNKFFKSTFTHENTNISTFSQQVSSTLSSISITEAMVLDKLLSLNSSKATGPDNLHPHLLKSCARTLYKPVFLIIQQSLTT